MYFLEYNIISDILYQSLISWENYSTVTFVLAMPRKEFSRHR